MEIEDSDSKVVFDVSNATLSGEFRLSLSPTTFGECDTTQDLLVADFAQTCEFVPSPEV